MFRRNISLPSSSSKNKPSKKPGCSRCQVDLTASSFDTVLARLIVTPWNWRRQVSPKRRLSSDELHSVMSNSKLCYDRRSVGQSVLVSGTHLGPANNFSPSLFNCFFRQLRVCWCGAPSLTRSWVCTFQFLLGITSTAPLRSESHGTHEHISLSLFLRLRQPGGPGSCIYFPRNRVAQEDRHLQNYSCEILKS
jgi:hypothetical protein